MALMSVPDNAVRDDNKVQPESGINFVLYNSAFEIVEENTGVLMVDDKINTIQTLQTDKMVMQEAGFLEIFIYNDAQTPVFFDNMMATQSVSPVKEVNAYYPFGVLNPALGTIAPPEAYNAYKYSAKELETYLNLGWLDFHARPYDPTIGRTPTPDPHAENFYAWSSYSMFGNNPINNIDPTGMDWYVFNGNEEEDEDDEEYKYVGKHKTDGAHRMVTRRVDKKGNVTYKFHDFNDPDLDAQAIDKGNINRAKFLSDSKVEAIMNKSGVNEQDVFSRWGHALTESYSGGNDDKGKMDYRNSLPGYTNKTIYVINGIGYNQDDAGNYLWGYGMGTMGFTSVMSRAGAHADAWWHAKASNSERSYHTNPVIKWIENRSWTGDVPADQRAIQRGLNDSGSYWKSKTKSIKKLWR